MTSLGVVAGVLAIGSTSSVSEVTGQSAEAMMNLLHRNCVRSFSMSPPTPPQVMDELVCLAASLLVYRVGIAPCRMADGHSLISIRVGREVVDLRCTRRL